MFQTARPPNSHDRHDIETRRPFLRMIPPHVQRRRASNPLRLARIDGLRRHPIRDTATRLDLDKYQRPVVTRDHVDLGARSAKITFQNLIPTAPQMAPRDLLAAPSERNFAPPR